MGYIDYFSNLNLSDDKAREKEYLKLQKTFGYLPVYGPGIQDVKQGEILLDHILKAYPGYRWVVEVRSGVITVINETLAFNWGFRLKDYMLDNDGHVIRGFAGELLERFKLSRGPKNENELKELKKNLRGEYVRDD